MIGPSAKREQWLKVRRTDLIVPVLAGSYRPSTARSSEVAGNRRRSMPRNRRAAIWLCRVHPFPRISVMTRTKHIATDRQHLGVIVGVVVFFALIMHTVSVAKHPGDLTRLSLTQLGTEFGIDIVLADAPLEFVMAGETVAGSPPDRGDLERYAPLLIRELSLYPKELVKRSGLKRIVLCTSLSYSCQGVMGVTNVMARTLYIDVSVPPAHARQQCSAIHHEFFHLVDYADDGVLNQDAQWSSLNPFAFSYGQAVGSESEPAAIDRTLPGFLNDYCVTSAAEDKAEVFANLIVNGAFVMMWAERDSRLRAKIIAMKRRVADLCPQIDQRFWDAAQLVKRPGQDPAIVADDEGANRHILTFWRR